MKFRAVLRTRQDIRTLQTLCEVTKAVGKRCVLKLSQTRIRLMINTLNSSHDGISIWVTLSTGRIFQYLKIQSKSEDEIFCETNLNELIQAFRTAGGGSSASNTQQPPGTSKNLCVMKLTKIGIQPILSFSSQITQPQRNSGSSSLVKRPEVGSRPTSQWNDVDLTHCVPVRILGALEVHERTALPYVLGEAPTSASPAAGMDECPFWISFVTPPVESLCTLLERFRSLSVTRLQWNMWLMCNSTTHTSEPQKRPTLRLEWKGHANNTASCSVYWNSLQMLHCDDTLEKQLGAAVRRVAQPSDSIRQELRESGDTPVKVLAQSMTFEMKRLMHIVAVRSASPTRAIIHCDQEGRCMILRVSCSLSESSFVYCIPSLID